MFESITYEQFMTACHDMYHNFLKVGEETTREGYYKKEDWKCVIKRVSEDIVVFRRVV